MAESDLARPTEGQLAWQDLEIGMFIHFAPNTWQEAQGDNLSTGLGAMDPAELDVSQWVDVAESMHARYIVFVAKHVGGFCMWPTSTTEYNIANTPWRGGGGDVCLELSRECARRNMGLGFYLSPRDDHFGVAEAGRSRSANERHQALYDDIYRTQLTELLTQYGPLTEVWFDGSADGDLVGPIVARHQPRAMVFQSKAATIRWIGNEDGLAPYPCWNTVGGSGFEYSGTLESGPWISGGRWLPAECDVPIRADWFWTSKNAHTLKGIDALMDIYYRSVGHGAGLLLNHTPDTTGRIPEGDAAMAVAFGHELAARFGVPIASMSSGRGMVLDLTLGEPSLLNHVVMMEDICFGERVLSYEIDALVDGTWQRLATGTAIGHKHIHRVPTTRVDAVRWRCLDALAEPRIRGLALY